MNNYTVFCVLSGSCNVTKILQSAEYLNKFLRIVVSHAYKSYNITNKNDYLRVFFILLFVFWNKNFRKLDRVRHHKMITEPNSFTHY
jgi:hypothetical protein